MATGMNRLANREAWISLLAAMVGVVLIACTQGAGRDVATRGTSTEPPSAITSPAPVAPQPTVAAGAGASTTSPTPVDPGDAPLLYAQCMRDNGVPNFPDPGPDGRFTISHGEGGISQDDPKFRTASEKCRELAPGGEHRGTGDPAYVEQMRAYSQCMRDKGLSDFPDPDADGRLRGLGHERQDDPKFRAAMEACAGSLPGGGAHR